MQDNADAVREPWHLRALNRLDVLWGDALALAYGLWLARVSAASVILGALLFYYARPAQDLFLEVGDGWQGVLSYWGLFYVVVLLFWVFPVYLSARWILARIESIRHLRPGILPVEDWVYRTVPPLLAAGCLVAVLIGQVLAVSNAPILLDRTVEQSAKDDINLQIKITCPDHGDKPQDLIQELVKGTCKWTLGHVLLASRAIGLEAAEKVQSDNIILGIYGICAAVLLWFLVRRHLINVGRKPRLSLAAIAWLFISIVVILPLALWVPAALLWNYVPQLKAIQPQYLLPGVAVAAGFLVWLLRAQVVLWWLFSFIVVVPVSVVTTLFAIVFVRGEQQQPYGLWHLALLLPASAIGIALVWWGLRPGRDRQATRVGQALLWVSGAGGQSDQTTATARLVNPIFRTLALITACGLVLLVVLVPPVAATDHIAIFRRGLLIPFFLGMLVPPLTVLSSWSLRARAPLIIGAILLIAVCSQLVMNAHKVRIEFTDAKRATFADSLDRWAAANDCDLTAPEGSDRDCPSPIIVAAAGGASRAAFHMAGLMGTLMDGFRPPVVLRVSDGNLLGGIFSDDGSRILTRASDKTARLWNSERGTLIKSLPHDGAVVTATFARRSTRIVTSSQDGTVRIWDGETGAPVAVMQHTAQARGAIFSPDSRRILSHAGEGDGTARIWDAQDGTQIAAMKHQGIVYQALYNRDGSRIVTRSVEKAAFLWNGETGAPIGQLVHDAPVREVTFSPDGKRVMTRVGSMIRLWDSADGTHPVELAHPFVVDSAVFATLSPRILTRTIDGSVRVWNAENGTLISLLKAEELSINGAIISRDGRRVLTMSGRTTHFWDAETGARLSEPIMHEGTVTGLQFSLDSRRFVTLSSKSARLGETERGTQIAELKHTDAVRGSSFSLNSKRLLTRSEDRTARLWNAETGDLIKVMQHEGTVHTAVFGPNPRVPRILTRAADGTMPLWSATGEPILLGPSEKLRRFGQQLFAISGVSGGALGAVTLYAALADGQLRRAGAPDAGALNPPCRADANTSELFASNAKEPPKPEESWKDCLQLLLAGDFLSPVFLSMIGGDLLGLRPDDRSVVLEQAWERRYQSITRQQASGAPVAGTDASNPSGKSTLALSLLEVRSRVLAANPKSWLPILTLNGTSVQTGRRIIVSDVDTRGLFRDAYDLHAAFGEPPGPPNDKNRSWDVRLSTAATISARFPGISPHGDIVRRRDNAVIDRVVDGGYYESFGASTALELIRGLENLKETKKHHLQPFVILVNNEPGMPDLDCVDRQRGVPAPPRPDMWDTFATVRSPFDAVLGTRGARGTHAAAELCNHVTAGRFAFVTVSQQQGLTKKELSVSWWLSKYIQRYLDGDLVKANRVAFEKIMDVLR